MRTPPIHIVTGFLGSGKTTLLREVIARGAGGRRIGLVVNEIGAIGFDGAALSSAGAGSLVELTDGCICCAAGSDFLLAIEELIDVADPDLIIVETTGLAEPGGMIRQVRAAGLPLDAVIAVADLSNLEHALAASPVAEWQLRAADLIVLSKIDLVDAAARAAAEARLRALNPRAALLPAAHGVVAPELLFGPRLAPTDPPPTPDHRKQDGFRSIVWTNDTPLQRAALTAALDSLPATVYRAKGVVHCTDAPWPDEVQFVAARHTFTPLRLREPLRPLNRLVLIGANLDAATEQQIQAALTACVDTPERAAAWLERYHALF
jgi:G3E family GTPase